jgi:hypothetical protein
VELIRKVHSLTNNAHQGSNVSFAD